MSILADQIYAFQIILDLKRWTELVHWCFSSLTLYTSKPCVSVACHISRMCRTFLLLCAFWRTFLPLMVISAFRKQMVWRFVSARLCAMYMYTWISTTYFQHNTSSVLYLKQMKNLNKITFILNYIIVSLYEISMHKLH